jgi:hypothetical protein
LSKNLFSINDGHASLEIRDMADELGDGSYEICVADGGGFSGFWGNRETLVKLKDALTEILEGK